MDSNCPCQKGVQRQKAGQRPRHQIRWSSMMPLDLTWGSRRERVVPSPCCKSLEAQWCKVDLLPNLLYVENIEACLRGLLPDKFYVSLGDNAEQLQVGGLGARSRLNFECLGHLLQVVFVPQF